LVLYVIYWKYEQEEEAWGVPRWKKLLVAEQFTNIRGEYFVTIEI
jgi:hypothetical protein